MKVIIAGGRNINDYDILLRAVECSGFDIDSVVSGGAPGVDSLAMRYAHERSLPCYVFPAEWKRFGRSAGPRRNVQMGDSGATALLAIWDGESPGTRNMIDVARSKGLLVYVYYTS